MCSGSEAGSYLRLRDLCITLNSRLESNKEEEEEASWFCVGGVQGFGFRVHGLVLGFRVEGSGFRDQCLLEKGKGFRDTAFGVRIKGLTRVRGSGFRVYG